MPSQKVGIVNIRKIVRCYAVDVDIPHIWYINENSVDAGSNRDNVVMSYATIAKANRNDIFVNNFSVLCGYQFLQTY